METCKIRTGILHVYELDSLIYDFISTSTLFHQSISLQIKKSIDQINIFITYTPIVKKMPVSK